MKKLVLLLPLLFTSPAWSALPGYLLLVGGGTERSASTAWNYLPYQWAVQKSTNKKVLVLGVSLPTSEPNWLPDYFKTLGATHARNLPIASVAEANQAWVYDTLMSYDLIFIRGGDQSKYYSYYKNTQVSRAIVDKYQQGGVVGGTSAGLHVLSEVVYTAQGESVTPDQVLRNNNDANITLKNDFLSLFKGYIFDSHFNERGRFGRLLGFVAHWNIRHNSSVSGIGVDDLTALCIDTSEVGTVYGTGAVHIYKQASKNPPKVLNGKLMQDSIQVFSCLQGWKYDFKKDSLLPKSDAMIRNPTRDTTVVRATLVCSGHNSLDQNNHFLGYMSTGTGVATDPVLLLTASDTSMLTVLGAKMKSLGSTQVEYAALLSASKSELLDKIQHASKAIFYEIKFEDWKEIQTNAEVLQALDTLLQTPGMTLGFIGSTARMAGSRMISDNFLTQDAAYTGALKTQRGLDLIKQSIIFPNSFYSSAMYENSASTVPYFMATDSLRCGFWVSGDSYFVQTIDSLGVAKIMARGDLPTIVATKKDAWIYGVSTATSRGDGSQTPRQVAGHNGLWYTSLTDALALKISTNHAPLPRLQAKQRASLPTAVTHVSEQVHLYPNPASQYLHIYGHSKSFDIKIWDSQGKEIISTGDPIINVSQWKYGLYFLRYTGSNKSFTKTFIVIP